MEHIRWKSAFRRSTAPTRKISTVQQSYTSSNWERPIGNNTGWIS